MSSESPRAQRFQPPPVGRGEAVGRGGGPEDEYVELGEMEEESAADAESEDKTRATASIFMGGFELLRRHHTQLFHEDDEVETDSATVDPNGYDEDRNTYTLIYHEGPFENRKGTVIKIAGFPRAPSPIGGFIAGIGFSSLCFHELVEHSFVEEAVRFGSALVVVVLAVYLAINAAVMDPIKGIHTPRDEIELRGELASLSYDLPLGSTSLVKALVDDLQSTTQAYSSLQAQEEIGRAELAAGRRRAAAQEKQRLVRGSNALHGELLRKAEQHFDADAAGATRTCRRGALTRRYLLEAQDRSGGEGRAGAEVGADETRTPRRCVCGSASSRRGARTTEGAASWRRAQALERSLGKRDAEHASSAQRLQALGAALDGSGAASDRQELLGVPRATCA
ncbi:hypothetical protein JL720_16021 [Aureococcus anophagefferens]|nr:hypothetical protein JL720_16021 [Aureococcus anophagefferens]